MRRQLLIAVAVGLAAVAAGWADDPPKPADPPAKSKTVAELKKEAEQAELELYKKYDELSEADRKDRKKVDELFQAHEKEQGKRYEAALAIAKADPKADAAFEAVDWLLTNTRVYYLPVGKPAVELATEHFAASPKIGRAVLMLGRYGPQGEASIEKTTAEFLKAVEEKNQDKTVRGTVAIVKAWQAKGRYERAEYRKGKNVEELATAAEKAFEAAVKEYAT